MEAASSVVIALPYGPCGKQIDRLKRQIDMPEIFD